MAPKRYSTVDRGTKKMNYTTFPKLEMEEISDIVFDVMKIRRERRRKRQREYLVAWAPTWEPAEIENPSFGKYQVQSVSLETTIMDGVPKRLVHWHSTWEPKKSLVIEEEGGEGRVDKSPDSKVTNVPPRWELRWSKTKSCQYFFNPDTQQSAWEIPESANAL